MVDLSFTTNNITVYSYEPILYRITNPIGGSSTLSTTRTSGIPASYLTNDANDFIIFATTSNAMTPGTQQFTVSVSDVSGVVLATSTNNVTVGPGRFVDVSGRSFVGSNYTFYSKETITPIKLVAPFNIGTPTSTPALPPGLGFSAVVGNKVSIIGTPLVTVPQSNYLIIARGVGSSKTVSSIIPFIISNERIQTNITGGGLIQGMQIGTAITPLTLTSRGNGTIRYTWAPFPDGIVATDNSGNVQPYSTSGFAPTDPSYTMIIRGTPTLNAANSFRNAGYSNGVTQTILVERINPLPVISSLIPITFAFGETVLFDTVSNPTLYTNVPLDPSANYYRAATYFTSNVGISNIFSPNLRSDLSLAFNGIDRAYLINKPTSAGTSTYTLRAVNSNAKSRDTNVTITIVNDSVTFSIPPPSAVDACYNFVLSRPIDLSLNGYYPSPIQYSASAASGRTLSWSAPSLSGTGLSLSASTGNTVTLVGTPSNLASLQTLAVTASVSSASATRNAQFQILNDVFTFASVGSLSFIQNKAITPIQFSATALSGRTVSSYSATGLPLGLSMSTTGLLTGTPTGFVSGSFTVTASTGFTNGSQLFSYNTLQDNLIVVMANTTETVPPTFSGVDFRALTYSGTEGVIDINTSFGKAPYQGITFDVSFATGNFLQGNFSQVPVLLPEYRFGIKGTAGNYSNEAEVHVTTTNPPTIVRTMIGLQSLSSQILPPFVPPFTTPPTPPLGVVQILRNTNTPYRFGFPLGTSYNVTPMSNWTTVYEQSNVVYGIHDMAQSGSTAVAVIGSTILRSGDAGSTWIQIPSSNIQDIDASGGPPLVVPPLPPYFPPRPLFGCIATDGQSNWVTLASGKVGAGGPFTIVRTSTDDGLTWSDISINTIADVNRNTRLFYNNSRYFLLGNSLTASSSSNAYASSSDLSTWTSMLFPLNTVLNDFTASNNTLLVVGSNGTSSACFSSSNNGTSWSPLPTSPIPYSGSASINAAKYAYGKWAAAGSDSNNDVAVAFSSDLATWSLTTIGSGNITTASEDGGAWQFGLGGTGSWVSGVWQRNGSVNLVATTGPSGLAFQKKRLLSTSISTGTPTLTMSIPYDPSDIAIQLPTQSSYINWQFVPINPITVRATTGTPSEFLYYYASGLPDGLSFVNDASGLLATVTGTSVKYSDAVQRVLFYIARGSNIAATTIGMRTILPTVQKQQSSSGAWTSLLRQYTEVNAATTSRDNKVTPVVEYRLGEFTSPDPPNVITEGSNCLC